MKETKKLLAMLKKYDTKLRETTTVVTHQVTGSSKELTPLQFAVYETCMKAHYLNWKQCPSENPLYFCRNGAMANVKNLADRSNFTLVEEVKSNPATDYYYCNNLIHKDGLYYDLLD